MRTLLAALAAASLMATALPVTAAAPAKTTADQTVVVKKKPIAKTGKTTKPAARATASKSQARGAEDALAASRARGAARRAQQQNSQGARCTGFFNCFFGASRGPRANGSTPSGQAFAFASYGGSRSILSTRTMRREVSFTDPKYAPGSLIVKTPERALYYVEGNGKAIRYPVGVGREGFQWSGNSKIAMKREWPEWRPPQEMIEREAAKGHILPEVMDGGPENPLGARAMYIAGTMFRVHGTNNEASIGGAVSSGCIRMMNADVIDLYDRVKVGARIYVYQ